MGFTSALITERLELRWFTLGDAAFLLELVNTPGWLRFIGDRKVYTLDDAEQYLLNGALKSYDTYGFGPFVLSLRDSDTIVGMCGLFKREGLADVDIGYALLPDYEGNGYACEAAAAVLDYARGELKLERIVAITNPDNVRSAALLKRIGLVYEQHIRLVDGGEELCLFGTR